MRDNDGFKQDFTSLVGTSPFANGTDRRGFLKTAIGTGFAAA
ncbi:MAG: carboxymethylenebutenolidase, partial [Herminiimonas sp.]|nr:carboxymethylenebutenolidase [Herminiimonas sp.]